MRILLLVNNWIGWQVTEWLKNQGEEIVGLVLHPQEKNRKYGDEIIQSVGLSQSLIFDGATLNDESVLARIEELNSDIAISISFDYILKNEFIRIFKKRAINLHPSYLPYNKGQYPNVWSIIEGTPSGVTLHYIDAGIDTGEIIAQKKVPISEVDTGKTLFRKLERASLELFLETWPLIVKNKAPCIPQIKTKGTYHRTHDVDKIDKIDLDRKYTARELINIFRARTFPPHKGAYVLVNGQKVNIHLHLYRELADE